MHPEYATAANRLGSLYVELDRFADAEECSGGAKVREERLGATHSTLQTVKHMLHAAELQEKWGEALAMRAASTSRGYRRRRRRRSEAAHAAAIAAMLLRTASVQRQAGEGAAAAASLARRSACRLAGGRPTTRAPSLPRSRRRRRRRWRRRRHGRAAARRWEEVETAEGQTYFSTPRRIRRVERPAAVADANEGAKGIRAR